VLCVLHHGLHKTRSLHFYLEEVLLKFQVWRQ
jgi:hypothetical protein